jgi:cytochrome c peroxidase
MIAWLLVACSLPVAPLDATRPPRPRTDTLAAVQLGHELFFEPRLSGDGSTSCATCHRPGDGVDDRVTAVGVSGRALARHTPALANLQWYTTYFWDGRVTTLEEQALLPIEHPDEMGADLAEVVADLAGDAHYRRAFAEAFPERPAVDARNLGRALAAYERTLVVDDTPFDRYLAGDPDALSDAALRGLELFVGEARCVRCHRGPALTDNRFHHTGVAGDDPGRIAVDRTGTFHHAPYPFFQSQGAFRTPGLRNVARTAPYMHNGSEATLDDVVAFYAMGGRERGGEGLSPDMKPLDLDDAQRADLVAFLREGLTGRAPLQPPQRDPPTDLARRSTPADTRAGSDPP